MNKHSSRDVSAYGNILINSPERLETFKETVANWQEKISIDMVIRIRGKFAIEAIDYCSKFANIRCEVGSDFIQWRNQAFDDIKTIDSTYVMMFLEDHQLIPIEVEFAKIIDCLKLEKVDIFQYSWFEHHKKARGYIKRSSHTPNSEILSLIVDSNNYREFVRLDKTYIVSLTSIFSKRTLLSLLKTKRPLLRRYDSRGPFDVEKSPTLSFYLPVKYALPVSEFALCVDDEMGIPGSSAISRGISALQKTKRGITHYSKLSPKYWISYFRTESVDLEYSNHNSTLPIIRKIFSKVVNMVNVLTNTVEFILFEIIDSLRKEFKN